MTLAGFRAVTQVAAGADGVAYRAIGDAGRVVEVRVLDAAHRAGDRWPSLARRVRVCALLEHPSALRVTSFDEDADPPLVVVEAVESRPLAEALGDRLPLPEVEAVTLVRALADAAAAAHRLRLCHGALGPRSVRVTPSGLPRVDLTGIDLGEPFAIGDDPSEDVLALGQVLRWLLTASEASVAAGAPSGSRVATLPDGPILDAATALEALGAAMLATSPASRPTAKEVVARLDALLAVMVSSEPEPTIDAPSRNLAETTGGDGANGPSHASTGDLTGRDRLGRYLLREKLGQGGMGAVYRGEDLADGTSVALKVLRPEWAAKPGRDAAVPQGGPPPG